MSWLSDITGVNIDVNQGIQNLGSSIDNALAERLGVRPVEFLDNSIGKPSAQITSAPFQAIGAITQGGGVQNIGSNLLDVGKRTGGALMSGAGGGGMFSTDAGQSFLNNSTVKALTLDASSNYAGFSRAGSSFQSGQNSNATDIDQSRKFLMTAGAIGGAAALAPSSWLSSVSANPTTSYTSGVTAYGAVKRGDYLGAINAVGGGDAISPYLPARPDWLPDINFNQPGDHPSLTSDSGVQTYNPWGWNGEPVPTGLDSQPKNTMLIISLGVVVLGAYLIARRKKI